ncbi:hypothetical protein RJT17_36575 [Streptomyces sp. P5-A9]|uniref:hypothetical protein n=1 Tax=Streptomyces sp. P5-A9 TaxID=3071730 RepID=UPI002FC92B63
MSAGFLTIALVLGGIVALTTDEEAGSTRTGTGSSAMPALTENGRPQGCRTDDSSDAVPMTSPEGIKWRMLGLVRVPVSAKAGPTHMDGGLWWCFARTPLGAVLAAHIITSQMTEKSWRTVLDRQIVAGQGRDIYEFTRSIEPDTIRGSLSSSVGTPTGFAVTEYTDSQARVQILIKASSGYAEIACDLRWSKGDWKVLPSSDGALHTPGSSVENPRGYVLWEG